MSGSILVLGWPEHAEGRTPASVVDSLRPVADGKLRAGAGGPKVSVVELDFLLLPRMIRRQRYPVPSTSLDPVGDQQTVRVTHPSHPWSGREFVFLAVRQTWSQDRVFFLDEQGSRMGRPAQVRQDLQLFRHAAPSP